MQIRVLGPIEVVAHGDRIDLGRPQRRALLAVLALRAGRPCSPEQLIDALWGGDLPAKPRADLQSHVAHLRRALEPDRAPREPSNVLTTVGGGYRLEVAPLDVDAHRFEQLVHGGRARLDEDDTPDDALAEIEDALRLWQGRPFPELGDTPFAVAERVRLEELRLEARVARLECLLILGRDEDVVADSEALVRQHPFNEPLRRAQIIALYRAGRQADALRVCERLRHRLREEFGIDPSAELRGLERAVLTQDPRLERGHPPSHAGDRISPSDGENRTARASIRGALGVREPLPFVGRVAERSRLLSAWRRATDGERQVVLVAGEPGVGKTRLALESACTVVDEGGTVLAGRCDERVGVAHRPFVEAFARHVDHDRARQVADELGGAAGHLGRLHPPFTEQAGIEIPPAVDPETDRYRLFDAVLGWLRLAAEPDGALLVVDDVHWATTPTLLLLRHVAQASDLPLLLVATYRETEQPRSELWSEVLADLLTSVGVERMSLTGLDRAGVLELVTAAGTATRDLDRLAEAIHRETEGNPFFVEELLRHLVETGRVHDAAELLNRPEGVLDLEIPDRVREVVVRRLAQLSEETRRVLQTAAVAGHEWEVATLVAAVGDEDQVVRAIEEALPTGTVREVAAAPPTYMFTHDLVRHAIEDGLSAPRRQRLHLRVAEAIEDVHGAERIGAIATHLRRAGTAVDPERAVTVSMAAAGQAWRQAAFEEASVHCEESIALLDARGGDPAQVARLRQMLGEAMYATRIDIDGGLDQLETARDAFEALGDERSAAVARTRIGRHLVTFFGQVDVHRAVSELEAAREVLEPLGPSAALADTYVALATAREWDLRADLSHRAAHRAVETAEDVGDEPVRLAASALAGLTVLANGELGEGEQMMARAHAEAVDRGDPLPSWLAAYVYAICGNLLQDPTGWYGWVQKELASGRYERAHGLRAGLLTLLRLWSLYRGRLDEAARIDEQLPTDPMWRAMLAHTQGRWDDATEGFTEVAERALGRGNRNSCTVALWWASRTREHEGRLDEATTIAERAARTLPEHPPTWATVWMRGRVAILRAHDRSGRGEGHLEACREIIASGEDYRGLRGYVALASAANEPHLPVADRRFAEARDTYRRNGFALLEAEVLRRWGLRGRPRRLDEALELYEQIGLGQPWMERLRQLRATA